MVPRTSSAISSNFDAAGDMEKMHNTAYPYRSRPAMSSSCLEGSASLMMTSLVWINAPDEVPYLRAHAKPVRKPATTPSPTTKNRTIAPREKTSPILSVNATVERQKKMTVHMMTTFRTDQPTRIKLEGRYRPVA